MKTSLKTAHQAIAIALAILLAPTVARSVVRWYDDDLVYCFQSGSETEVNVHGLVNTSATHITIPSTVVYENTLYASGHNIVEQRTCRVTGIGPGVFRNRSGLLGVTIPDSVMRIEGEAFRGCSGLTNLTIPNSVTDIGSSAFYGCSALANVVIPNSMTNIGSSAFRGCSGLTSVTIPDSVTDIWSYAFAGCRGLTNITIPDSVTSIGSYAFSGCGGLTSLTIPDSVTILWDRAFQSCKGLKTVTILGNVTNDWKYTPFYDCTNIESIVLGGQMTKIGDDMFDNCPKIQSLTIPNSVTSIGNYAFSRCSGLTSLTIPDSVTNCGKGAFFGCSGLTNLAIPRSLTSIGWGVFSGCSGLTSLTIPDSVASIDSYAFQGCSGLTSLTIPDSVASIDSYAFQGCSGLTTVTILGNVTNDWDYYRSPFYNCTNIESIVLGGKMSKIGNGMFAGCLKLHSLTIPNGVTGIGDYAFSDCCGLARLTIPDSVTDIGLGAFEECSGLASVLFEGAPPIVNFAEDQLFYAVSPGTRGYYTSEYAAEWKAVLDENGMWEGLVFGPMDYAAPVAESPIAPQASDVCFVVKKDDTTCGNIGSIEGKNITFTIPIDRYFGNKQLLLQNEGLPETVTLSICVWDVDEAAGEVDEISVNGKSIDGRNALHGGDRQWKVDTFQIPTSILNLKGSENDATAMNEISIDVSTDNPGRWVTRVEWAALDIPAPPPVVISHGIFDSAGGMKDLKDAVEALGLPVHTFSYSELGFNSIEAGAGELARGVKEAKEKFHADKVTILCHSMGGLKARHYTTEIDRKGESVDRVIQIATPNAGSEWAKVLLYPKAFIASIGAAILVPPEPLANWMLADQAAFYQLTPEYMKGYNNDRRHRLNPSVHYTVLAGDRRISPYRISPYQIMETWLNGHNISLGMEFFWSLFQSGDNWVSVASAHSVVPPHAQSPVMDTRATHGGLVTRGPNGMVDEVVEKLREDLLKPKGGFISGTESLAKRAVKQRDGNGQDGEDTRFAYAVRSGEVSGSEQQFQIGFGVPSEGNRLVAVNILTSEAIGIDSVRSPSGIEYTSNEGNVFTYADDNGAWVLLAFPEQGQWTVTASRNSAGSGETLSCAVILRESDPAIALNGGFVADTVVAGGELVLEVEAIRAGTGMPGLTRQVHLMCPDGTTEEGVLEEIDNGKYRAVFAVTQPGVHVAAVALTIDGMEYAETFMGTVCSGVARFDTLVADAPADDDGDGVCDRLSVSGTLDGTVAGASYRVFGVLANQEGEEIAWTSTMVTNGLPAFRLDFDGRDVYGQGQSGGCVVSVLTLFEVGDGYEAELDSRDGEVAFDGPPPEAQEVAFDANGGSCGTSTLTYAVGEAYGTLPIPKCSGHAFLGWWTEKDGGELVTADSQVEPVAELTLYAHWTHQQVTTFLGNGGKPATQATTNTIYTDYGAFPEAKRSGHAFVGWFNAPEGGKRVYTNSTVTLAATRTLYAQWTTNQVTTFKANGGYPATQKTTNNIYADYGAFPEVKYSGHALVGWFNAPEGGKRIYTNSTVTLAATRTLYAQWTTNQVTTFKGNGGTPETQKTTNAIYTHYGTLPEAVWENHAFLGWFNHPTKGNRVYTNSTVTLSATRSLYAHWTDQQAVTLKGNGGTPSTVKVTNTMGTAYGTLPTPKKSGYALLGWFTKADGGDEVTAQDLVTAATSRTLYAHWTDQQVTTFLGNGGTPETQATTNTIYAKYAVFPTATWEGHAFQGWYNAAEGGKRVYTNSTVTLAATRTLYAHWTTAKGFAITAIAVAADGGEDGPAPRTVRGEEKAENVCRLRFELSAGTEYEIQWTPSMAAEWETVERLVAETDGEVEIEIEVPGGEKGFFRLVALQDAGEGD